MKRCIVRPYVNGAEIYSKRQYVMMLDFDTPEGLREAEQKLDALAYSFARADGARGPDIVNYYLAVHDYLTNVLEFHRPAKDLGK